MQYGRKTINNMILIQWIQDSLLEMVPIKVMGSVSKDGDAITRHYIRQAASIETWAPDPGSKLALDAVGLLRFGVRCLSPQPGMIGARLARARPSAPGHAGVPEQPQPHVCQHVCQHKIAWDADLKRAWCASLLIRPSDGE